MYALHGTVLHKCLSIYRPRIPHVDLALSLNVTIKLLLSTNIFLAGVKVTIYECRICVKSCNCTTKFAAGLHLSSSEALKQPCCQSSCHHNRYRHTCQMTSTVKIAADQVSSLFDLHHMHIIPMPDSVLVST